MANSGERFNTTPKLSNEEIATKQNLIGKCYSSNKRGCISLCIVTAAANYLQKN